ncbi:G-type lectin S-receptor-like serine/threonine-protein kinase [Glycine max]|nr:G-type lectin S-receptor-like serine/threonine-protein kinase [Glycine max]
MLNGSLDSFIFAVGLVHMYDQLNDASLSTSRQLAGYITLLQYWIYEHFLSVTECNGDPDYDEVSPHACRWIATKKTVKKLGWDLRTALEWKITAWKSPEDPSPGDFSFRLNLYNYPEFYLMKGRVKYHRLGPWNGLYFSGATNQNPNQLYEIKYVVKNDSMYVMNEVEKFCFLTVKNSSAAAIVRVKITETSLQIQVWEEERQYWSIYTTIPGDRCDEYAVCGAYGNCRISQSPVCQCLEGFTPRSQQEWSTMDWSQGCVVNKSSSCEGDRFVKHPGLKVPETDHVDLYENIDLEECREKCLNNCYCVAYTNSDIRGGGKGCVLWYFELKDIRQFETGGQDLYIRMPALESDKSKTKDNLKKQLEDLDLRLFDLLTITTATNNFSLNNKIGQGGFGPVYKGKLADGRDVAVKRLSSSSGQGITEFMTEVKLIAKLQHRNLVKLLGCCIRGQEKILVYEYMVNGSLDSFVFDQIKGKFLDWPQRLDIIFGIARGLLYLHQDSRLRIIHRDLKASNILLDEKLNPKISDFGMARAFGGDQTEGNTNRVVAVTWLQSTQLMAYFQSNLMFSVLAWTLWKEQNVLQLIDSNIMDSCVIQEVLRCIHVSLLCVQQYPEDRPTMTSVIQMLGTEMELVEPKEPGFFPRRISNEGKLLANLNQMTSNNELTITLLNASYIHCGVFELGFFSSGNSTKRYLGILYKNISTGRDAWVANQNNPISNLELKQNNSVVLVTTYQNRVWDPVAELLDNGNLVIRNVGDANSATYLWQSFDYLSDTLLPKMKLGWDLRTGLEPKITSWKSPDDPSPRYFSWGLMLRDYPEFYAMIGTCKYFCTGPWNGVHFSGL